MCNGNINLYIKFDKYYCKHGYVPIKAISEINNINYVSGGIITCKFLISFVFILQRNKNIRTL